MEERQRQCAWELGTVTYWGADHVEFIIGREERGRVVGTSGLEKLGLWHFPHQ
jgi:hypothetical protein